MISSTTKRVRLFGADIDLLSMLDTVKLINTWLIDSQKTCRFVVTPNVDHIVKFQTDKGLQAAYQQASLIVTDGKVTNSGKQLSVLQAESELLYFRKNHGFLTCVFNIFLVILADFIQTLKDLLKLKWRFNKHFFASSRLTITSAIKTRMGSTPVR